MTARRHNTVLVQVYLHDLGTSAFVMVKHGLVGSPGWLSQLCALDLSSGLDPTVVSSSPALGSALGVEPT